MTEKEDVICLARDIALGGDDFYDNGNIKASSLMYHFQEIATEHADVLGISRDELMTNHWIWVLSKLRFRMYGSLIPGKRYRLTTYPRPKKGVIFNRDYYLSDSGKVLAAGISQWCIINFDTRKIERTDIDFDVNYIDHPPFEDGIGRIKLSEPALAGSHTVDDDDMDENMHTNNCRYADIIDKTLGLSGFKDYTICFQHETVKGDVIDIFVQDVGDSLLVMGKVGEDKTAFTASVAVAEAE